jgi:hypothetical protein
LQIHNCRQSPMAHPSPAHTEWKMYHRRFSFTADDRHVVALSIEGQSCHGNCITRELSPVCTSQVEETSSQKVQPQSWFDCQPCTCGEQAQICVNTRTQVFPYHSRRSLLPYFKAL